MSTSMMDTVPGGETPQYDLLWLNAEWSVKVRMLKQVQIRVDSDSHEAY